MSKIDLSKYIPGKAEELPYPHDVPVQGHPDYFYPLNLTLNQEEKAAFMRDEYPELFARITLRKLRLVNLGNFRDRWTKTVAETDYFLRDIGLKVTGFNLFTSISNVTAWSIHKDGTMFNDKPIGLEARLSYYELAHAPGVLRWWTDEDMPVEYHDNSTSPSYNQQNKFYLFPPVVGDLRDGKIGWADLPAPAWQTSTNTPSGLLRVNRSHHVIQGDGIRITLGAQITFLDGNPTGVWDYIRENVHKILG